jgi:predicted transcriptional regulator of viral defense system
VSKRKKEESKLRYLQLFQWILDTAAWKDLSTNARCVYIELARRYAGPGSNNGTIPMSLSELATELHIGKATAMRALDDLIEHGFIEATRKGSFNVKGVNTATEWLLTEHKDDRPGHAAELPKRTFARWQKSKHGFTTKPERVPTRNRAGSETKQSPKVTMGFGSTTKPGPTLDGFTTEPLIVYQPIGSSDRHSTVEDEPVELSHDEARVLLKLKEVKTATHRLVQQHLSPGVKGEAIRAAAASLAERGLIRIGQKGRSDIYILLGPGERAEIQVPETQPVKKIDFSQFDMFGP